METVFDTIRDACLYYEDNYSSGAAFATQPVVHGIKLDFHVYVFDNLIINGAYPSTLFSLCKSEDCATQVIICKNINIYSGYTLTPPYRCKGLIIHCADTFYNNRGYVKMTSRGCKANGQNIYMFKNPDINDYEIVPATGASGGSGGGCGQYGGQFWGVAGANGVNRQSGGGGSGSARNWRNGVWVGRGGYGTCYSGGVGSGSAQADGDYLSGNYWSDNAPDDGGAGSCARGNGANMSGFSLICLGGQGNPPSMSASWYRQDPGRIWATHYGSGGLIIIFATEFNNNGYIQSQGSPMLTCQNGAGGVTTGGASGGGSININYGILINSGSTSASGGKRTNGGGVNIWGGYGGNGCVTFTKLRYLRLIRCTSNFRYKVPDKGELVKIKAEYINDPLGVFTGFLFEGIKESDVTYDDDTKLSFSFIMPDNSVMITANYKLYKINCIRCSHNAPKIPLPGEKYIITAPSHYIMNTSISNTESFTTFSCSGIKEPIKVIDRLTFEFIMPAGDINVTALFSDFIRKNTDVYKQINKHQFIDYYNIL